MNTCQTYKFFLALSEEAESAIKDANVSDPWQIYSHFKAWGFQISMFEAKENKVEHFLVIIITDDSSEYTLCAKLCRNIPRFIIV